MDSQLYLLRAKKMPVAVFSDKGPDLNITGYNTDHKTFNTRGFRKSWQRLTVYLYRVLKPISSYFFRFPGL